MARKRNRTRSVSKRSVAGLPGVLERPVSARALVVPVVVDIVKTYSTMGIMLSTFIVSQFYLIPLLFWGTTGERLVGMAYCLVAAFLAWPMYKPADEIYKLSQAVPIERIDFRYVAPRRNRMVILCTVCTVLYLLPVLYVEGVITLAASAVNKYFIQNQKVAQTLAWICTAALTGLIGNIVTTLLGKIAGALFRRKQKE